MKTQHLLSAAFAATLSLLALPAHAGGTLAGTNVTNQATVNYDLPGDPGKSDVSNVTDFEVDAKIDLTVDEVNGDYTFTTDGALNQALVFTVTNDSNTPLDFALTANQAGILDPHNADAVDDDDVTNVRFYVEDGTTAGFQIGEDTLVTFLDEMAIDETRTVYVVSDMPGSQLLDEVNAVELLATARGDFTGTNGAYAATGGTLGAVITATGDGVADTPGTVDIVFVDGANDNSPARDGADSDRDAYQIKAAVLTVTKTATVISDPTGAAEPKAIPGAFVRYVITIFNNTPDPASNVKFSDPLNTNTHYQTNSLFIDPDGTGLVQHNNDDATADGTGVTGVAGTNESIVVDFVLAGFGDLASGDTAKVQFNVEIQ